MIKPIETEYDGYRFRSRLEARWAVFFKHAGVAYEYEPEGFRRNGVWYLPDFRVKCWGTRGCKSGPPFDLYIEVKGDMDEESAKKIKTFSRFKEGWEREAEQEMGIKMPDMEDCHGAEDEEWWAAQDAFDDACEAWAEENLLRILVVGDIPNDAEDFYCMERKCRFGSVYGVTYNNYVGIDDDDFGAMPAVDHLGHFYLFGQDSNYVNDEDVERVNMAYRAARSARFEHGQHGALR